MTPQTLSQQQLISGGNLWKDTNQSLSLNCLFTPRVIPLTARRCSVSPYTKWPPPPDANPRGVYGHASGGRKLRAPADDVSVNWAQRRRVRVAPPLYYSQGRGVTYVTNPVLLAIALVACRAVWEGHWPKVGWMLALGQCPAFAGIPFQSSSQTPVSNAALQSQKAVTAYF